MSYNYRENLEKIRDLKLKKDDLPPLRYEDEVTLLENPVIIDRQHVINVLKRYKQERISEQDLFDWIHFVWFSDLFTCADEDAECIASVMQILEELEEEGDIIPEEIAHCLYALEHNMNAEQLFG